MIRTVNITASYIGLKITVEMFKVFSTGISLIFYDKLGELCLVNEEIKSSIKLYVTFYLYGRCKKVLQKWHGSFASYSLQLAISK